VKQTFTSTSKVCGGNCADCGARPSGRWWFNWRRAAQIRVLCDDCYQRRASMRVDAMVQKMLGPRPPLDSMK